MTRKKKAHIPKEVPLIEVRGLTKTFHVGDAEVRALRDVSFCMHVGEFAAVTGRSGSGKSTLLYQMGALDHPTSGEVIIDGVDITRISGKQRTHFRLDKLGYVFQDYALLPELTATENVMVPLLMQGATMVAATGKAREALARVGLADRLENRPAQLSGGQQQRVAIARAIAHEPKILFADEPTANLDTETSETILDLFIELNTYGQTILMVTHEKEYASLTERVITLADGEIISDKVPKKVQSKS
ncbi:MAG: ABC transporter ATP-binding protein [Candidatus Pacebacteria bacterium]|nr:ABC transporter ATP-binding protein [Candidatus Paceibacterota bacterium]